MTKAFDKVLLKALLVIATLTLILTLTCALPVLPSNEHMDDGHLDIEDRMFRKPLNAKEKALLRQRTADSLCNVDDSRNCDQKCPTKSGSCVVGVCECLSGNRVLKFFKINDSYVKAHKRVIYGERSQAGVHDGKFHANSGDRLGPHGGGYQYAK